MALWLCLRWWYGAGWNWALKRAIGQRLQWCNQTFSVLDLMRTWGAPFKQTYNSSRGASMDLRLHNALDKFISRCVGFCVRSFIILAGAVSALFVLITGALFVVLWPFVPLAIPISLGMMLGGVGR